MVACPLCSQTLKDICEVSGVARPAGADAGQQQQQQHANGGRGGGHGAAPGRAAPGQNGRGVFAGPPAWQPTCWHTRRMRPLLLVLTVSFGLLSG